MTLLVASLLDLAARGELILPSDERIEYSDYARLTHDGRVPSARFDRIIEMPRRGYNWNNPGARIRFSTDATEIVARLYYSERHVSQTARNGVGLILVDGVGRPEWQFTLLPETVQRTSQELTVSMPVAVGGAEFHDYEIVLPYGDAVEFRGVEVNAGAAWRKPSPRPMARLVAYGDSVTQGFDASDIGRTYAYLIAEAKGWQLINVGFGGRASRAEDGKLLATIGGDVVTILMGVNDWQGGVPLARYRSNIVAVVQSLRAASPTVPIYVITPLWVRPEWKPRKAISDLESYRRQLREIVAAARDPNLRLIEGPALIDPDAALFGQIAVHPNDAGFAMMADRLSRLVNTVVNPTK